MNSTGMKPPLSSSRRTTSRAPVACWMPAVVGEGTGVGGVVGPLEAPGVAEGAALEHAASDAKRTMDAAARTARRLNCSGRERDPANALVMARETASTRNQFRPGPHGRRAGARAGDWEAFVRPRRPILRCPDALA